MARFNDLINTETNEHHRRIFETIAKHESAGAETEDGYQAIALDASELALIRDEAAQIVQDARPGTQSAAQMRENMIKDYGSKIEALQKEAQARARMAKEPGIVQDGYYNPVSGIGTIIDPGMQTESFIPVSITPTEATEAQSEPQEAPTVPGEEPTEEEPEDAPAPQEQSQAEPQAEPKRGPGRPSINKPQIINYYLLGRQPAWIAQEMHCDISTVYKTIKEHEARQAEKRGQK